MSTPVENTQIGVNTLHRNSSFFLISTPATPGFPGTPASLSNSKLVDFWNLVVAEETPTWESLFVNIAIFLEIDMEKLDTVKLRKRLDPANSLQFPTLSKLALAIKDNSPEVYFQKFVISDDVVKAPATLEQKLSESRIANPLPTNDTGKPLVESASVPLKPAETAKASQVIPEQKALPIEVAKESASKSTLPSAEPVVSPTKPLDAKPVDAIAVSSKPVEAVVASKNNAVAVPAKSTEPSDVLVKSTEGSVTLANPKDQTVVAKSQQAPKPVPIAKFKESSAKFEIDLSLDDLFPGLRATPANPINASPLEKVVTPQKEVSSPTKEAAISPKKDTQVSPKKETSNLSKKETRKLSKENLVSPRAVLSNSEPDLPKKIAVNNKPEHLPLKSLKDIKVDPVDDSPIHRPVLDPFSKAVAAAEKGSVQAMCQVASYYMTGKHTAPDSKLAFEWYTKAADQNDPESLNSLAMFYLKGIEIEKDIYKAVELYSRAADGGCASGMYNLAMCFRDGIGYAKDEMKAVDWFQKASNMGNIAAMNRLGMCYQLGTGVEPDPGHAFALYLAASESENSKSFLNLAYCYEEGIGTSKDILKAFEYYLKAAEKGNNKAQFHLGELYEKGIGCTKDKELAKEW